jgi:DNA modification methylase
MIDITKRNELEMKKSGKIYNLHSYWTKQPVEVIENFISSFSKEGETILDCFAGTGMTGVAAKKNKRKSILYDLSPICCHISKGYTSTISNNKELDIEFEKFKLQMESKFSDLLHHEVEGVKKRIKYTLYSRDYECPECKTIFSTFDDEVKFLRTQNKERGDNCPNCKYSNYKKYIPKGLQVREITLANKPTKIRIPSNQQIISKFKNIKFDEFPNEQFFGKEPKRNYKYGITKVYQLYSNFNLHILQEIKAYIDNITNEKHKSIFLFVFSSILFNCSLLSAYTKYENTVYRTGTYYIPRIIKDNNPLDSFYSKFKTITKTLSSTYDSETEVKIINRSATNMAEVPDCSVDFVYIDPPYSDMINYSELNLVWESWLGLKGDYEQEVIVNSHHGKSLTFYLKTMTEIFQELHRVLKINKKMTLIFHHPKPEHWRMIQKAIYESGFSLVNKQPIQIRSKSLTHSQINTNKSVQGFLGLVFEKSTSSDKLLSVDKNEFDAIIHNLTIGAKKQKCISKSEIYDYIITKLFPKYEIQDFTL